MFSLGGDHRYFLYRGTCDMRKGFDGLVSNELGQSPTNGSVFVFFNKPRNQMKLLHWEAGGLVLYHKRLELGRFSVPVNLDTKGNLSWPELVLIVEGISYLELKKRKRFVLEKV